MAGCMKLGVIVVATLFLFFDWQLFWNNDSAKLKSLASPEESAFAKTTLEFIAPLTIPKTRPLFPDPQAQTLLVRPETKKKPDLLPLSKGYTASQTTQISVPKKLLPVDEGAQDPSFLEFRTALRQAIQRRDAKFLIGVLDKNIKLSFGTDSGIKRFIEMWDLYSPQSTIWRELGDVLSLGGTFGYGKYSRDTFWAPYVFGLSGQLGDVWDAVIVGNNVQAHAQPSNSSPVIAVLSYDVVKLGPYDPNPVTEKIGEFSYPWKQIRLTDQRTGYVYGRYVRSPLDYRAAFKKIDGAWKLTVFVKGD